MTTSLRPEIDPLEAYRASKQADDPLTTYRRAKESHAADPLESYRGSRSTSADTGDIDLRSESGRREATGDQPVTPRVRVAAAPMLDPGGRIAQAGADYLGSELRRGGAALVRQAKDIRDNARLHGAGRAALHVGQGLARGVVDPLITLGKTLPSTEDEMAGTPDSERSTGLAAYNRETERLAQLAAHNVRNNTTGEDQDVAADEAAREVRRQRKVAALTAPIQTAANLAAPGVFKAV